MVDLQRQIEQIVAQAAAQIAVLVRDAAFESLTTTLDAVQVEGSRRNAAPRPTPSRRATARKAKGEKRPPGELEAIKSRVSDFIAKNPGLRIEQINAKLGTQTKALALPLRKLIAERAVKTQGEKRATTYYPAKGSAKTRRAR